MVALASMARLALAAPQPAFDVGQLLRASDLVCVSRVEQVLAGSTTSELIGDDMVVFQQYTAYCDILSVLSGRGRRKGDRIQVVFKRGKDIPIGLGSLAPRETSILFLVAARGSTTHVFAQPRNPKIPLGSYDPGLDDPASPPVRRIESQLLAGLRSQKSADVAQALEWLERIGASIDSEILTSLASGRSEVVVAGAVAHLVRQGDQAGISRAMVLLLEKDASVALPKGKRHALAWALEGKAGNITLSDAEELATSGDPIIAQVGLRILAIKGSESSLPVLAQALDHPNREVQYRAIVALARISGRQGCGWRDFMADPAMEARRWREWLKEATGTARTDESGTECAQSNRTRLLSEPSPTAASPVAERDDASILRRTQQASAPAEHMSELPATKPTSGNAAALTTAPQEAPTQNSGRGHVWTYIAIGLATGLVLAAAGAWLLLRRRSGG